MTAREFIECTAICAALVFVTAAVGVAMDRMTDQAILREVNR